jgi:hypothetical protein
MNTRVWAPRKPPASELHPAVVAVAVGLDLVDRPAGTEARILGSAREQADDELAAPGHLDVGRDRLEGERGPTVHSGMPSASAASAVTSTGCGGSTATVEMWPRLVTCRIALMPASATYQPPRRSLGRA